VENHLVLDAFGNVTSQTAPTLQPLFLFTARPFDPDTALQNNLHRWYDPAVGRWVSEDPIRFQADDTNLYRYVHNWAAAARDPYRLVTVLGIRGLDETGLAELNFEIEQKTCCEARLSSGATTLGLIRASMEPGKYTLQFDQDGLLTANKWGQLRLKAATIVLRTDHDGEARVSVQYRALIKRFREPVAGRIAADGGAAPMVTFLTYGHVVYHELKYGVPATGAVRFLNGFVTRVVAEIGAVERLFGEFSGGPLVRIRPGNAPRLTVDPPPPGGAIQDPTKAIWGLSIARRWWFDSTKLRYTWVVFIGDPPNHQMLLPLIFPPEPDLVYTVHVP